MKAYTEDLPHKNGFHRRRPSSAVCTSYAHKLEKPNVDQTSSLRLGSVAPNFQAETTNGPIDFHEYTTLSLSFKSLWLTENRFIGDKWVVLFSHPEDYTPVCTTELGAFAKLEPEFSKRGVKLIGLSANTIDSHGGWIKVSQAYQTLRSCPLVS